MCGAATLTRREADQRHLQSFEIWRWRRVEEISRTNCVTNEEVLHPVKGERNILQTVNRRKVNWIGHMLLGNCLLKHVIVGKDRGKARRDGKKT